MDDHKLIDNFKCPFCLKHNIESKPGKIKCPECSAEFEIDDRLECIFADISKMRLTVKGFVCSVCGLVQGHETRSCVYCAAALSTALQ